MATYTLNINTKKHKVEVIQGTSLLWVIREHLGLTGTKYGCGIGQCGSCTIHINGTPTKACLTLAENVKEGQKITTIEGLSEKGDHPLQKAWIQAQAPQCGYCQSGQLMQAAALLEQHPSPSRELIKTYMSGNLCRCGTYMRIVKAIELASEEKIATR